MMRSRGAPRIPDALLILAACQVDVDHRRLPPSEFPGPENTGYAWTGVALVPYAGSSVLGDGARLEGADVAQCLVVQGRDARIVRSRVRASCGDRPLIDTLGADLVLEDVEIDGAGTAQGAALRGGDGLTLRRVHIHGVRTGIVQTANGIEVADSLIAGVAGDGFLDDGFGQVMLVHNTVETDGGHGAIVLWNRAAEVADVLVLQNLVASAGDFTVHGGSGPVEGRSNRNVRFIGNVWARSRRVPLVGDVTYFLPAGEGSEWRDNVDEGGQPVDP